MQEVTYTNKNNESIRFGIAPPYILQRIEGTGDVDVNIHSQGSPKQDGRTYLGSKLEPREVFLQTTIYINESSELFKTREMVQGIFNPKLGEGILEYHTPNGTKFLHAVPDGTPVFSRYDGVSVVCQITLLAFDPFWYDYEENEYMFEAPYMPLFEFPFFSTSENELEFGREYERTVVVNEGTASTPLIIEFHGGIKSAKLINLTNGECIEIKKELLEEEILTVNTSFGKREVRLNNNEDKSNGFKYLTMDSKFFQLEEGRNDIEYIAEADRNVTVGLKWTNRYIGL